MKIICIGRNYVDHAKEMNSPVPTSPVIFMKPETALIPKNHPFHYPSFTKDLHFECELVIRIKKVGKHIEERFATKYFTEIGVGIDFTARDLQASLKEKGLPWEKAKAWDHSAPIAEKFITVTQFEDIHNIAFSLHKNGKVVQQGNSSEMIFSFERLIAEISKYFTLKIGDLIFTGTPSGVGSVEIGDHLEAFIGDEKMLDLKVN
jgi:2-keto-4-pentenoate hydratase/2-oxohepta-3-ene-1,7-dioic acid hydratase in catechol pathway